MKSLILLTLISSTAALTANCGVSSILPDLTYGVSNRAARVQTGEAITNSHASVAHSWPWTAAVCQNDWLGTCKFKCTASIIGKRWALTTANCFSGDIKDWRVRAGVYHEDKKEDGEQRIAFQAVYQHTSYSPQTKLDNIMLIHVTDEFQFNDYVQPICLPDADDDVLHDDKTGWITGWGYQKKGGSIQKSMEQAMIDMDTNEVCERTWSRRIYDSEFCAGEGDRTLCNDDEGVPLMMQSKKGTWFQHGSAAMIDGQCQLPGIFSKLTYYCNWVNATTQAEVSCIKRSLY